LETERKQLIGELLVLFEVNIGVISLVQILLLS